MKVNFIQFDSSYCTEFAGTCPNLKHMHISQIHMLSLLRSAHVCKKTPVCRCLNVVSFLWLCFAGYCCQGVGLKMKNNTFPQCRTVAQKSTVSICSWTTFPIHASLTLLLLKQLPRKQQFNIFSIFAEILQLKVPSQLLLLLLMVMTNHQQDWEALHYMAQLPCGVEEP